MNNIEKGLAEKVMYAIYIDRQKEVEDYFREYLKHTDFLGKKKDVNLLEKTSSKYTNYQMDKARELMDENELFLRM